MTMNSLGGNMPWPRDLMDIRAALSSLNLSLGSLTFDSNTDRLAYVGHSPIADSIKTIYWRAGTVTSPPANGLNIQVVTVGTDGRPTTTLWNSGSTNNSNVLVTPSGSNTWQTATLTGAPVLSLGSQFAILFSQASGTFDGTHLFNLNKMATSSAGAGNYPLCLQDTGAGTWAQTTDFAMIVEMTTAGVIYLPGLHPVDVGGSHGAFSSASSPNEVALQFRVPFKCRAVGLRFALSNASAGANFTCSLWDTGTTDAGVLGQIAIDGDSAASTTLDCPADFFFTAQPTLTPGTTYYAGVRADTANTLDVLQLASPSGITNSMYGFAIPTDGFCQKATRVWTAGTAGAWTTAGANANILPLIHILIDQIDYTTGGGGVPMSRIFTGM